MTCILRGLLGVACLLAWAAPALCADTGQDGLKPWHEFKAYVPPRPLRMEPWKPVEWRADTSYRPLVMGQAWREPGKATYRTYGTFRGFD